MTRLKHILYFLLFTAFFYLLLMVVLCNVKMAGTALIYRVINYAIPSGKYGLMRFEEFGKSKKNDVVFIGSSHAIFHYNTKYFDDRGYAAYNLGTQNQTLTNTYLLAKNYITSANCKLLVVDFYTVLLSARNSNESSINLIASTNKPSLVKDIILEHKELKYINNAFIRLLTFSEPYDESKVEPFGYYKGSVFSKKTVKKDFEAKSNSNFSTLPYINRNEVKALDKLLKQAKQADVQVVLCSSYQNKNFRAHPYLFFLADSVCKANQVPFLDLTYQNNLVFLHDFADGNHLNYYGEQIYNKALVDTLESLNILKH